jgi:predicted SAM-dependent methyltransferase
MLDQLPTLKKVILTVLNSTGTRSLPDRLRPSNRRIIREYLQSEGPKRLQLGCGGEHIMKGWLNTDIRASGRVAYLDATTKFPLPDNVFDLAYSEHMIEHIPYEGGVNMLSEIFRVLRPGGKVRIATPDFVFLKALHREDPGPLEKEYIAYNAELWCPGAPPDGAMFVINNFFRNWGHQFIYDQASMTYAMKSCGFAQVKRQPLLQSDTEDFRNLEFVSRMRVGFLELETMVMEATKPGLNGAAPARAH